MSTRCFFEIKSNARAPKIGQFDLFLCFKWKLSFSQETFPLRKVPQDTRRVCIWFGHDQQKNRNVETTSTELVMDNVSIFSFPSSSRWLINCSVKTCQALKSTEDISVLMITDFAGFDWSTRLEEEISIDLGPGAMICYCHRTRRFEKRAGLEFETGKKCISERWQNGKFTNNSQSISTE